MLADEHWENGTLVSIKPSASPTTSPPNLELDSFAAEEPAGAPFKMMQWRSNKDDVLYKLRPLPTSRLTLAQMEPSSSLVYSPLGDAWNIMTRTIHPAKQQGLGGNVLRCRGIRRTSLLLEPPSF